MMEKDAIETIPGVEEFHRAAALSDLARSILPVPVEQVEGPVSCRKQHILAVDEPLQIRLNYEWKGQYTESDIAITMRTPGHDTEQATGFLFSEGILRSTSATRASEEMDRDRPDRDRGRADARQRQDLADPSREGFSVFPCGERVGRERSRP